MKLLTLSLLSATATALPQLLPGLLNDLKGLGNNALTALNTPSKAATTFDPTSQLVSVTGNHAWKAPTASDARGPCPGLNALANHGYLPRSGVANILQLATATNEVYGMGLDLSTVLAVYGAVLDGQLVSWSIGGVQHAGISGSRGNYETDSSPMRGDLNQYGSNVDLQINQFKTFFNMQPNAATANYDLDVLGKFREVRYNQSVNGNPNFYYAPFAGTDVSQAAFTFIYRFMANHTEANPEGILDQYTLKSFFSVTGNSKNLKWTPGHERIPENWFKRPLDSPYGVMGLSDDISNLSAKYPFIGQPGCNTGKVNTFTPLSQTNTSAQNYDFSKPTDGLCYGIATALDIGSNVPVVGDVVEELLLPIQNALVCPTLAAKNESIGQGCPGYSLYGGPTGKIAKGAIQY